jgi:hypothetical protein
MQAFFDDEPLPRIFGLNPAPPYPTTSVEETETAGWKQYTGTPDSNYPARMLGTIEVKTTDRHRLKFAGLTNRGGSTGNPFLADMVHFIPTSMAGLDQVYPRFNVDGTPVPKP